MCIIIDANRLGDFLTEPPKPDVCPVREWLMRGGTLVYSTGGKFATEMGQKARERLRQYVRDGRARQVPHSQIAEDVRGLSGRIRSNDPHVLALARFSGARVLYTGDNDLIQDFKDKAIIARPRGSVYSGAGNAGLLSASLCRRTRRKRNRRN